MRMTCILALKALYGKRESAMKLGLFFYKFKVNAIRCRARRGAEDQLVLLVCRLRAVRADRLTRSDG